MRESTFQSDLIKEIEQLLPRSIVLKIDPTFKTGMPDLLILFNNKWAMLECKQHKRAHKQPNQERRIDILNRMSFARFIYPENKQEVLYELQSALRV